MTLVSGVASSMWSTQSPFPWLTIEKLPLATNLREKSSFELVARVDADDYRRRTALDLRIVH